ncbi:hypothetical protein M0R45_003503 [Rubus argutus]|uniref:Caffeoyl-CoA O-methyltransferase n=1 Tax=Rubus argutus TaxID=59490 RepID=A0AAW1YGF0_RUBAR
MENTRKQYILKTCVYPREPNPLNELRIATANHPMACMGDAGQLMAMLLKLLNPKNAIEIGVFTGYSLLLTALTIPDDGKVVSICSAYSRQTLGKPREGREFRLCFVDADKNNYWNYHKRLMKLIKIGGLVIYDNTLWGGTVALPEGDVAEAKREWRQCAIEFNKLVSADPCIEMSQVPLGDGITICRFIC